MIVVRKYQRGLMIRNYKFGVDMDNTLTDSPPLIFEVDNLEALVESVRFVPVKKGVDVISTLDLDITIITGRGESFRKVTIEWLVNNNIEFRELVMIGDYKDNKFNMGLYLEHKLNAYLSRGIHFALDDDDYVVNMLNCFGVRACKVDGDFRDAFNKLFK